MTLVLDAAHPVDPSLALEPDPAASGDALRIGIVNLMPRLQEYETSLLRPLAESTRAVRPVFLRLESHVYRSSDPGHLARHYQLRDRAGPLDGVLLTGAPIEHLPVSAVRYWPELVALLDAVRAEGAVTLGVCWGGLALAALAGLEKRALPQKLFGVFTERARTGQSLLEPGTFVCAQSRHAGIDPDVMARAEREGRIELLSDGDESGSSIFQTPDGDRLMHLGHPEYEGERLAFEWHRDRAQGRADVRPPRHFDAERADTPWRGHRNAFFGGWLAAIARRR